MATYKAKLTAQYRNESGSIVTVDRDDIAEVGDSLAMPKHFEPVDEAAKKARANEAKAAEAAAKPVASKSDKAKEGDSDPLA